MMERVALSAGRCGSECVEYSSNSFFYEKDLFSLHETKNYVYLLMLNEAQKKAEPFDPACGYHRFRKHV